MQGGGGMKKVLFLVCIVVVVITGALLKYLAYNRGYYKGYCRGYNEALDTCVHILHKPVKDSSVVAKVVIEDSTVTHVFYLRKKRASSKK